MKKVCIFGFGRLGKSVYNVFQNSNLLEISDIVDIMAKEDIISANENMSFNNITFNTDISNISSDVELIIICTTRDAFLENYEKIKDLKKDLIIATTNIEDLSSKIKVLAENNVVVQEPNFDFGFMSFRNLFSEIASKFGCMKREIVEIHHTNKIDVSGTSKKLCKDLNNIELIPAENIEDKTLFAEPASHKKVCINLDYENIYFDYDLNLKIESMLYEIIKKYFTQSELKDCDFDFSFNDAKTFETTFDDIKITSKRFGDIIGIHGIVLKCPISSQRLVIYHEVTTRDIFANGVLRTAENIHKLRPGIHNLEEILGL